MFISSPLTAPEKKKINKSNKCELFMATQLDNHLRCAGSFMAFEGSNTSFEILSGIDEKLERITPYRQVILEFGDHLKVAALKSEY